MSAKLDTVLARTGEQGVALAAECHPDLVLLDLGLPGEDGFSICRQLRANYANPILILTARDSDIRPAFETW